MIIDFLKKKVKTVYAEVSKEEVKKEINENKNYSLTKETVSESKSSLTRGE